MTLGEPVATRSYKSNNNKQLRQLSALKKREHWMKWGLWIAVIIILLLILVLGAATDWTRGLHKDESVKLSNPSLDTAQAGVGTDTSTANTVGTGTKEQTASTTGTEKVATATNNSSTTTTNTTNTTSDTAAPGPTSELLSFYSDSIIGESLDNALQLAKDQGLNTSCSNNLFIRTCEITDGNSVITMRSLLGLDDITSITKNF